MTNTVKVEGLIEALNQGGFVSGVPVVQSGDDGKVLTASVSGSTKSYSWAAPATELPDDTGASQGDVLAIGSTGLEWTTFIAVPDYSEASVGDILTITADGPAWVTPEAPEA